MARLASPHYFFYDYTPGGFTYILSSRLQNDPLEQHFGVYRQMSGGQYNISVVQILESERRLKLSSIL